jgi:hypothetical protein
VLRFFTETVLDVEATKKAMADSMDAKRAGVAALQHQAQDEVARSRERLARVRADYVNGKLDANDWRESRDELATDLEAAEAQLARLEEQHQALADETAQMDAEDAVVDELSRLRSMIVGEVRDALGLDAFRTALRRVFAGFELTEPFAWGKGIEGSDPWQGESPKVGSYMLIPHVAPGALDSGARSSRRSAGWPSPCADPIRSLSDSATRDGFASAR